jgi:hypothetical protein
MISISIRANTNEENLIMEATNKWEITPAAAGLFCISGGLIAKYLGATADPTNAAISFGVLVILGLVTANCDSKSPVGWLFLGLTLAAVIACLVFIVRSTT